jgi:hypothetical protein
LFGAQRQPLSGSSGRNDLTRSDSNHDRLFIETKLRAKWSVRALHDEVRKRARKETKIPVLALASKGRPGCLLVIDSGDLPALVRAFAEGNRPDPPGDESAAGSIPRTDQG